MKTVHITVPLASRPSQRLEGKNRMSVGGIPLITRALQTLGEVQRSLDADVHIWVSTDTLDQVRWVEKVAPPVEECVWQWLPRLPHYTEPWATQDHLLRHAHASLNPEADAYVLAFATSPYTSPQDLSLAILLALEGMAEVVVPTRPVQAPIWSSSGQPISTLEEGRLPRLQDRTPDQIETMGWVVVDRYVARRGDPIRRAVVTPYPVSYTVSIDIDTQEDLDVAEQLGRLLK